jgi:hypothetical protein
MMRALLWRSATVIGLLFAVLVGGGASVRFF